MHAVFAACLVCCVHRTAVQHLDATEWRKRCIRRAASKLPQHVSRGGTQRSVSVAVQPATTKAVLERQRQLSNLMSACQRLARTGAWEQRDKRTALRDLATKIDASYPEELPVLADDGPGTGSTTTTTTSAATTTTATAPTTTTTTSVGRPKSFFHKAANAVGRAVSYWSGSGDGGGG